MRVDRLESRVKPPLIYCENSNCAYFCSSNRKGLHRYTFESTELQTLDLEEIDTLITDLVIDTKQDVICILSRDCPGDVIMVNCDNLQPIGSMTLPENLECRSGVLKPTENQIVVVAKDQLQAGNYLVQINMRTFTTDIIAQVPSSIYDVVSIGFYESNFFAAFSGEQSKLMCFDGDDLTHLDSADCSEEFGLVKFAAKSENTIVLLGDGYPSRIDVFCCDPFALQRSIPFTGTDERIYCPAINPLHNQLMISRNGSNPAKLVLIDLESFSRFGEIEYDMNSSGRFALLSSDRTGEFTYGYHDGEPAFLVKIRNDNYRVDAMEPLNLSGPCVDMVVDQEDSLYIIYGETLARHNLQTLEHEESIVLHAQPFAGLKKILLDTHRDELVVINQYGTVYKVNKLPLQVINETGLAEITGIVTDGIYIADQDLCVFALNDFQQRPARLIDLLLDSFSYRDECECDDLELEISSLIYDDTFQVLNLATYYHWGGILTYKTDPFVRLASNTSLSVRRFTEKGVFDMVSQRAYWLNSALGCSVFSTHNTNKGYVMGSLATLPEAADIRRISLYSHLATGSVRLAIYDDTMQLLWESTEIVNTCQDSWIQAPITEGFPSVLELSPGDYWLTFQVNSMDRVSSAHEGKIGDGFRQPAVFGSFPEKLWYPESTSDRWALFAYWEPLFPTVTPTADPTTTPAPPTPDPTVTPSPPLPTQTPEPTATDTQTPTATMAPPAPTESPIPTNTPTSLPTSPPYIPGVHLLLSQDLFMPGDIFLLSAQVTPELGTPIPATLWIILDIYGSYWFGPGWTQDLDWYSLGRLDSIIIKTILEFTWPPDCGSLYDIAFWGAMLHAETWELIGTYDRKLFGFHD